MKLQQRMAHVVALVVVNVCALATPALAHDCPELVGRLPGAISAVAVSADFAYFGGGSGLFIADVSDPSTPRLVGKVASPFGVKGITVSDGYAFVAEGGSGPGLRVIDVSTPSAPVEVGHFDWSLYAWVRVAVSGGSVFLAAGEAGLYVFSECSRGSFPDPRESFIPAAAVAAGAEGAFFQTDVEVNNKGMDEAQVSFQWLPRGQDNSEPRQSDPVVLAPGHSVRFENVLTELFGLGPDSFGSLKLVASTTSVIGMSWLGRWWTRSPRPTRSRAARAASSRAARGRPA